MDRLLGDRGVKDPAVIEAIVGEYGAPVYRLALSILRDPDDSQDVAQETFIQAIAAIHRYRIGTNFKAWLLKIAVNNCRMLLRKRAARRFWLQARETLTHLVAGRPETESQVVQDETCRELWDMVDRLDEKYRLVILLRLAHGMQVSEISQVLGLNEKTVYSRLYEALARLRIQLQTQTDFEYFWDEVRP